MTYTLKRPSTVIYVFVYDTHTVSITNIPFLLHGIYMHVYLYRLDKLGSKTAEFFDQSASSYQQRVNLMQVH